MSVKGELLTDSIAPRITAVLAAAEQSAALVAQEAETEASRRTNEVIAGAYADAERIRREATRRVEEYLAASRRRIDAFAAARIERITELTEGVIEASGSIQDRFEQAAAVQREVHAMVEALGTVAEAVAGEVAKASPTLPTPPPPAVPADGGPAWAQTGPDGSVVGEAQVNGSVPISVNALADSADPADDVEIELEQARGEDLADALEADRGDARETASADGAELYSAGVDATELDDEDGDELELDDGETAPA
jgi:hypothetical protein